MSHDIGRDASQEQPPNTSPAVATDDDHVGVLCLSRVDDGRPRLALPDQELRGDPALPGALDDRGERRLAIRPNLVDPTAHEPAG